LIDPKRREMFTELYRMAEYYEDPPFRPGDIEGNSQWFIEAQEKHLKPFILKYPGCQLAADLAVAVIDEASRKAAKMNREVDLNGHD
jgi:hypothetical protein